MMSPAMFERLVTQKLSECGYWALKIPRNEYRAQPFDVIAIKGTSILAIDCKMCESKRFPLSRVEYNQWASFEIVRRKTSASIGLFVWHDNRAWFISYEQLCKARDNGDPSIDVHDGLDITDIFKFNEV